MININNLSKKIELFYKLATEKKSLNEILKELSSLETFTDRINFAEKHLKHLSSGSSRIIYLTDDKMVVKISKNTRGEKQNQVEADPRIKSKYINETLAYDKNGVWKISPYREKITEKEFEEMTGFNFKEFGDALGYGLRAISNDPGSKEKPENFSEIEKSKIYKEIVKNAKIMKVLAGDLKRISSYGKTKDHPIILDFGLTRNIYDEFYTT